MKVGAIVLAAGRSSRFEGGNKLLADIGGEPLVRRVLDAVADSAVRDIVLVTAPEGASVVRAAGTGRWRAVVNEDAESGLSTSIRAGLSALDADADGTLIVLADMPDVSASLIDRLISGFVAANGQKIVYPQLPDGRQGQPVLWPKSLFGELAAITGDKGGKALLQKFEDIRLTINAGTAEAAMDIDTRDDLKNYFRKRD